MDELLKKPEVLRQVIMEHYQHPLNHGLSDEKEYQTIHNASVSCIDDLKMQLKIEDGVIVDTRFDGVACTIATASTSIISQLIKGKSLKKAMEIIEEYYKMIDQQDFDENLLEEAYAFHTVGKQANRIKCARIGIEGFAQLIKDNQDE